jgi:hypothetical protein
MFKQFQWRWVFFKQESSAIFQQASQLMKGGFLFYGQALVVFLYAFLSLYGMLLSSKVALMTQITCVTLLLAAQALGSQVFKPAVLNTEHKLFVLNLSPNKLWVYGYEIALTWLMSPFVWTSAALLSYLCLTTDFEHWHDVQLLTGLLAVQLLWHLVLLYQAPYAQLLVVLTWVALSVNASAFTELLAQGVLVALLALGLPKYSWSSRMRLTHPAKFWLLFWCHNARGLWLSFCCGWALIALQQHLWGVEKLALNTLSLTLGALLPLASTVFLFSMPKQQQAIGTYLQLFADRPRFLTWQWALPIFLITTLFGLEMLLLQPSLIGACQYLLTLLLVWLHQHKSAKHYGVVALSAIALSALSLLADF